MTIEIKVKWSFREKWRKNQNQEIRKQATTVLTLHENKKRNWEKFRKSPRNRPPSKSLQAKLILHQNKI